jgi:hypothetical protein
MNRNVPAALLPLAFAALAPAAEPAGPPTPGDVQTRVVVSLSLAAGPLESESKRVVYTPPPGWHVRSHRVFCKSRTGLSSYAVNTVAADWHWSADDSAATAARDRVSASAPVNGLPTTVGAVREGTHVHSEQSHRSASHHALVVEATAKGAGLFQGGGAVELTVTAELVYAGE